MKIRDLFRLFHLKRKPKSRARTRLEELERRLTPAQNTWIGPPGGGWGVAANWDTIPDQDRIPAPGDNLLFGNPGCTGSSTVDDSPLPADVL